MIVMMVKIRIDPSEFTCSRASCRSTNHPIDRHHVRSQKLFVTAFGKNPLRRVEKRYTAFVRRYEAFRKKDIRLLCRDCHSEIHEEYMYLRIDAEIEFGRYTQDFTWRQANALMKRFEAFFHKWIENE